MGIDFWRWFFTETKIISKQRDFALKTRKNGLFLTIYNLSKFDFANRRYGGAVLYLSFICHILIICLQMLAIMSKI